MTTTIRSATAFVTISVFAIAIVAVWSLRPVSAGDDRVPGQYIVVLKDSVTDTDAARDDISRRVKGDYINTYHNVIKGYSARLSDAQVSDVRKDPRVAFVSEDRVVTIADSADARSSRSEGNTSARGSRILKPSPTQSQSLPTGVNRINAENKVNKGAGVNVAIVDTGIDVTHPDLKANIAGGKNCTTSNTSAYADQNGHGTHVAGTVAAADNGLGVVGVAPQAKLWAVRVLDKNGNGTWSSVICGLDFVTSKAPGNGGPITVANMSLSGGGVSDDNCGNTNNDALHKAICRAHDAGVTVIVAAGNSGANAANYVPAAYSDAVITVSALVDTNGTQGGGGVGTSYGADDTFATFSNYGVPVTIGAPGMNIYSTWMGGGYATISGTSMASPHVAGAAALYIATHPGASWTQVRDALVAAGESNGSGHTDPSGRHPEAVLRADTL